VSSIKCSENGVWSTDPIVDPSFCNYQCRCSSRRLVRIFLYVCSRMFVKQNIVMRRHSNFGNIKGVFSSVAKHSRGIHSDAVITVASNSAHGDTHFMAINKKAILA